jgi:hypothetical protein
MLSRRRLLQLLLPALAPSGRNLAAEEAGVPQPYLQDVRSDRASICWTSAEPGGAVVICAGGESQPYPPLIRTTEITLPQRDRLFLNEAVAEGLTPGAEYAYALTSNPGERFRFRTPSAGPIRLIVFGDSGSGSEEQLGLVPRMLVETPDLALHTGDLAYPLGTQDAYRSFYFTPYRDMMPSVPFYPCPGNHDYIDDRADAYRAFMRVPEDSVPAEGAGLYYSFDWGEAHFVSLDPNAPLWAAASGSGRMLAWLDEDLKGSKARWKIPFFHHTPYATGNHEGETTADLVHRFVVPILERRGVRLVFAGHEHSYQRSHPLRGGALDTENGTVYVTTGGGGGGLYPAPPSPLQAVGYSEHHFVSAQIEGDRMHVRAIGLDGTQLDAFSLNA